MADGFVQSSSIMPQKRNPVALEHHARSAARHGQRARSCSPSTHAVWRHRGPETICSRCGLDVPRALRAVTLVDAALRPPSSCRPARGSRRGGWHDADELADTWCGRAVVVQTAHTIVSDFLAARRSSRKYRWVLPRAGVRAIWGSTAIQHPEIETIISRSTSSTSADAGCPRVFGNVARDRRGTPDRDAAALLASTRDALAAADARLRDRAGRSELT